MRSFTSLIAILPPPLIIAVGLNRNAQTPPVQQTRIHRTHWHTLSVNPERWSKRSSRSAHSPWEGCETVNCLHNLQCLTLFFFFMHLCFTSARLSITRRLPRWMEGRQGIFSLQRRPSHRRTPALTYLDQSVIHLSQHFTKVGAADLSDIIKAAYTLHLNPERESIMKVVKQLNYDLMCWLVVCCTGINELMWDGAKMNERLKR